MPYSTKAFLLLPACCLAFALSFCQQANNWYFGNKAGLSFGSNPPQALADGALNSHEGCASISNDTGRLQFYTDGVSVWNRQHQVMPNGAGLKGNPSTTNSAIIVPKPGSRTIYYIFTADAYENNNAEGYNYSEVDMSLNDSLGDVTANKNVLLYAPGTEKLAAARAANGIDVWVITKDWGNNVWKAYKVDCNGVHTSPVVSAGGSIHYETRNGLNVGSSGGAKVSPDGAFLASTRPNASAWELLQFDNNTGILSNALHFSAAAYGVEFSPNSKLVYLGVWSGKSTISQYDISVYDAAAIQASQTGIGNTLAGVGSMQLGPDGKLYCAEEATHYLGVINAPDNAGVSCNYGYKQIDLKSGTADIGLTNFINDLAVNPRINFLYEADNTQCATIRFKASTRLTAPLSWQWDFGDGSTATGQQVEHTYILHDSVWVRLTVSPGNACGTITIAQKVIIAPVSVHAGNDTMVAIGQPLQLAATGAASYVWSPATGLDNPFSPTPLAHLNHDIVYYLTGTNTQGCAGYDSLHVKVYKGPDLYMPNAFTPNGDGHNDLLKPVVPGIKKLDYFAVYNRAGRLLFRTTTPGKGWDGTLNGLPQPHGTYVWIVQAQDYTGALHRQKGVVILLR